jgi:CRISPR-associated protein Csb2
MHIAGMVRHLAKATMQRSPPTEVDAGWVERYVVGHRDEDAEDHRQFSYLPLPSIGYEHADQAVRRVMIAAPVGGDAWLEHLAQRLAGRRLRPESGDEFGRYGPPTLIRVYRDKIARRYTAATNRWASVTPVVLTGHDDRKPAKTRKLIDAALAQSGIDQPCTYEWSALSHFRKSLSAYKYDRNKRPVYLNPRYLQELTAVHLTLAFDGELEVPGPLVIGAGRHCGFGLMAELGSTSVAGNRGASRRLARQPGRAT